ncbi:MAG: YdeI/OmpD-associated family protein [Terriglobales bacterium]
MAKPRAKSFPAPLERSGSSLNWVIIRIPFDVAKTWGRRGQLKVKGEVNGFAFRTSLFPTGKGDHIMIVNKGMQAGARAYLGMVAAFRLEPDTEERVITVPVELKRVLSEDRSLHRWFEQLSDSTRREISKWITGVKSAAARMRRAEQMAERLLATMEAEQELPPILQVAFSRDPRARQGWERMSPTQRRGHLLGIFYYRSPEARARRVAKTVAEAAELAEKKAEQARQRGA